MILAPPKTQINLVTWDGRFDMVVEWMLFEDDEGRPEWCSLNRVDLSDEYFTGLKGVYIIWSNENVVRIGSGIIKDRLSCHQKDSDVQKYPTLKVTWAKVNANQMQNVETHLANVLEPIVGERFPYRKPIEVNLPW